LAADSSELVSSVGRLLDSARQFGARVVHSTYEGNLGGRPTGTARLWRVLGPATAGWAPGSASTTVLSELLAPTDLVLPRHHGLFPTLDSELLPVLKGWDVRTVVLAGVSLNLAITHTAGHLTQAGFDLVVPRDAVGGTPQEYANQVLDNTIAVLGRLTTVDQLIGEWTPVRSGR
jgi:nicotinamidase-related amidase